MAFSATLHLYDLPDAEPSILSDIQFSSLEELSAIVSSTTSFPGSLGLWVEAGAASGFLSTEDSLRAICAGLQGGTGSGGGGSCGPSPPLHIAPLRLQPLPWLPSAASEQPLRVALGAACARWPLTAHNIQQMAARLQGMALHLGSYADEGVLAKARGTVPAARLVQQAAAAAAAATDAATAASAPTFRLHLLRALLGWFKGEFFKWVHAEPCSACGGATEPSGGAPPTQQERDTGRAGHVELHKCKAQGCGAVTRFPRFNAPAVLLDTRRGRCGEWANAFCLVALSLGFEVRHVTDFTDHVWCEVHDEGAEGGRWRHVDPCEAALDTPLLYEKGWGKKLSFVFAAGLGGFRDVTRRCACGAPPPPLPRSPILPRPAHLYPPPHTYHQSQTRGAGPLWLKQGARRACQRRR